MYKLPLYFENKCALILSMLPCLNFPAFSSLSYQALQLLTLSLAVTCRYYFLTGRSFIPPPEERQAKQEAIIKNWAEYVVLAGKKENLTHYKKKLL